MHSKKLLGFIIVLIAALVSTSVLASRSPLYKKKLYQRRHVQIIYLCELEPLARKRFYAASYSPNGALRSVVLECQMGLSNELRCDAEKAYCRRVPLYR